MQQVAQQPHSEAVAVARPNARWVRRLDAFADWWFGGERWWHLLAAVLFVGTAIAFTWPLALVAGTHVPYKPSGDQLWILSVLEWQRHAAFEQPGDFFTGNFYYGSGGALFGSDLFLGLLPLYVPLAWITGNPVLAVNLTHIGAYALDALAMYAAALTIMRSRPGALAAGAIYAFGALQLTHTNHLQLLAAWWLPLALLFAVRFARTRSWRSFGIAVLLVWIQAVTAVQIGLNAALVVLAFGGLPALWMVARDRDWRLALRLIGVTAAVSLPFLPIVLGYMAFAEAWRAQRDITEVQNGSAQLRDYLSPGDRLRWFDVLRDRFPVPRNFRRVFPGFVPLLLAAGGLLAGALAPRLGGRRLRYVTLMSTGLIVTGVLFSLGTHWKWNETVSEIELPYLALFDHVLIFRAVRMVARFSLLANVGLALLAAVAVAALIHWGRRAPRAAAAVGVMCTALVLLETFPRAIPVFSIPERPVLSAALERAPPGPILFVPVTGGEEVARIWTATRARSGPLVNGYSGHIWQQTWYFRDATEQRSVAEAEPLAEALRAYGIRNVVLHEPFVRGTDRPMWAALGQSAQVESVIEAGEYTLITLRDPAGTPATGWDVLEADFLASAVPAAHGFVGTLVLRNPADQAWIPPQDSRVRAVQVRWIGLDGQADLQTSGDFLPPPFMTRGQAYATTLHMFTPPTSGNYQLQARIDGELVIDKPVRVGIPSPRPFQGSGDGLLAALWLHSPEEFETYPTQRLPLHVDALNIGTVGWTDAANIRLGWRWYAVEPDGTEREVPKYEGRLPLLGHLYGDIPPGTGYAFPGDLRAPDEPGKYVVRVSMLSELVAWFSIDPIEIAVTVSPWPDAPG